jgi:hypothetical protein
MDVFKYFKNSPKSSFSYFAFFLFMLLGLFLRLEVLDNVVVNEWVTRDFDRAFNLVDGNYIPLAGPEATNGGRLPGPFLYFLMAIPLLFNYSYDSIFVFNLLLNIASIGVLFYSLKKIFGLFFACTASTLVCINTYHISGVFFPINPSFIFLFISLFIWFYFKLIFERKTIFLPFQILVISLAIQAHYTLALLYLVPFISIVTFKIKIPLKHIFLTVGLCLICFTPFLIYKQSFYQLPINEMVGTGFEGFSFLRLIGLVTIFNTITNIVSNAAIQYWSSPNEMSVVIGYATIYISILTLIIFIFFKYKKNDLVSCKKQLVVFLIFYIPSIIYEINNPNLGHYWYAFIFIVPTALLLTEAGFIIYSCIKNRNFKNIFCVLVFSLFTFLGYLSVMHVNSSISVVENRIFKGVFEGRFKNYQKMLGHLMVKLSLNPKQFAERVYFLDARPSSIKRLEFAYNQLSDNQKENIESKDEDFCYFLINNNYSRAPVKKKLLGVFLRYDKSIVKGKEVKVSFDEIGFNEFLNIIFYKPKEKQSCYNNSFNSFVVNKEVRQMLSEVKGLHRHEGFVLKSKLLQKKESYDKNNRLLKFRGSYVFLHKISGLPFKFNLSIKKEEDGYHVKTEIIQVYFWRNLDFHFSKIELNILPKTYKNGWTLVGKKDLYKPIIIIPQETMASTDNNMSNVSDWNYSQFWNKEQIIPDAEIELIDGQFKFFLSLTIYYDETSHCCASNLTNKIVMPIN